MALRVNSDPKRSHAGGVYSQKQLVAKGDYCFTCVTPSSGGSRKYDQDTEKRLQDMPGGQEAMPERKPFE